MQGGGLELLDTCIYGVLVDKKHKDYETVRAILDYAKKHGEQFVTTFIVISEIRIMKKEQYQLLIWDYLLSVGNTIENMIPEKYPEVQNLTWRYIQKLKIEDANAVYSDAENYAGASYCDVDKFVTINRRDIPAKEKQPIIGRINREIGAKQVNVITPKQFLKLLKP